MITCPNCSHLNPEGANQCEACYTPLPVMTQCPNCGEAVQEDAAFCGNCGYNLQQEKAVTTPAVPPTIVTPVVEEATSVPSLSEAQEVTNPPSQPQWEEPVVTPPALAEPEPTVPFQTNVTAQSPSPTPPSQPKAPASTQLQTQAASLLHLQTQQKLELPIGLSVIHIGRPNDQIPPDLDVSPFPNSDVVSRIHADIRLEEDGYYYLEDMGSVNGTYVNGQRLLQGNRHRLRNGDRLSLGKQDKVSFVFQLP